MLWSQGAVKGDSLLSWVKKTERFPESIVTTECANTANFNAKALDCAHKGTRSRGSRAFLSSTPLHPDLRITLDEGEGSEDSGS